MTWIDKNEYYLQNGDYYIAKTGQYKVVYGLYCKDKILGFFETSAEAKAKFNEITKG
jgi:hypothetical protein